MPDVPCHLYCVYAKKHAGQLPTAPSKTKSEMLSDGLSINSTIHLYQVVIIDEGRWPKHTNPRGETTVRCKKCTGYEKRLENYFILPFSGEKHG